MDINQMRKESNDQMAKTLAIMGTGVTSLAKYVTGFPANFFKNRKELKESGENYKFSDILSLAHQDTSETINFDEIYDKFYQNALSFFEKGDEINRQALKTQRC